MIVVIIILIIILIILAEILGNLIVFMNKDRIISEKISGGAETYDQHAHYDQSEGFIGEDRKTPTPYEEYMRTKYFKEFFMNCYNPEYKRTTIQMWIFEQINTKPAKISDVYIRDPTKARYILERTIQDQKYINQIMEEANKYVQKVNKLPVDNSNEKVELIKNDSGYLLKYKDDRIKIPKWLFKKLNCEDPDLLYVLMRRYTTFIKMTSSGMQLAVEPELYDVLRKDYDVTLEGFGSPINHFLDKFGSIFYDIDKHFGSVGSFFATEYITENATVNPPYQEEIIENSFDKIQRSLEKNPNLVIFWTVPVWEDAAGLMKANESEFLIKRYLLDTNFKMFMSYTIDSEKPTKVCPCGNYIYVFSGKIVDLSKFEDYLIKRGVPVLY